MKTDKHSIKTFLFDPRLVKIILGGGLIMMSSGFASCSVEEFPNNTSLPEDVKCKINLHFEREMPIHQEIEFSRTLMPLISHHISVFTKADDYSFNYDHPVSIYSFTCRDDEDFTCKIPLPQGECQLAVFSDYPQSSEETKIYIHNFPIIEINSNQDYTTHLKDCYSGSINCNATEESQYDIVMTRPVGKYVLISTDVAQFYASVQDLIINKIADKEISPSITSVMNPDDYTVTISYHSNLANKYDIISDQRIDISTSTVFKSKMSTISDSEILLASDHLFLGHDESSIDLSVKVVHEPTQNTVTETPIITVPLHRGRITVVKGNILTTLMSPGVSIDNEFEGSFNIEIK